MEKIKSMKKEIFTGAEKIANQLCGENINEIENVEKIEYPEELNSFIIVLKSGRKYLVEVNDYTEE